MPGRAHRNNPHGSNACDYGVTAMPSGTTDTRYIFSLKNVKNLT